MTINNLKELQKLILLCRKTGINSIKIDNIEFHLGAEPRQATKPTDFSSDFPEASIPVPQYNGAEPSEEDRLKEHMAIATEELTPDQLLFYSAVSNEQTEQQ